jgi:branched-chain amino acid aminotransferase
MSGRWIFLNDGFVPEREACLHYKDLALQRGYGAFDFFRVKNQHPLFLDAHLERFLQSARQLHLDPGAGLPKLKELIAELITKNGINDGGIRLTLTGGYSPDGFKPGKPNLLISQQDFLPPPPGETEVGISLITHPHQRQLPEVKSIDYLMAIWLQPIILAQKAQDVLYHNNGWLRECPRSNLFILDAQGVLATPGIEVLKGITRKRIIRLAENMFEVWEREIHMDELHQCREAFICSTTRGILPVKEIDGIDLCGNFPVARVLSKLLEEEEKIAAEPTGSFRNHG